jgi:hypothetical protein
MSEEKVKSLQSGKAKKKYVYLDKYELHKDITEQRLEHLESMNMLHWAVHILTVVGVLFVIFK